MPTAPIEPLVLKRQAELSSGGVKALNYSTAYIHRFGIYGPGNIRGGGPNVMPVEADGEPSGGGKESCCMTYPLEWQPDLKLTVRWLAYKSRKDKVVVESWYKAENVKIPKYNGQTAGGVWAIFLPGDRVRVMIPDGIDPNGGNNPDIRPPDNDPYIAQGIPDEEWNLRERKGGSQ